MHHRLLATEDTTVVGVIEPDRAPVLTVDPGDTVSIQTAMLWGDRVQRGMTLAEVGRIRRELYPDVGPHTLTGPIEVRGAEPGDVLRVDLERFAPIDYGINIVQPGDQGRGLLPEDFTEGRLVYFEHDLETMTTTMADGRVRMPLEPFLGILSVAPPGHERILSFPPGPYGGNIDCKDLVAGTTLYLPVWRQGAMFSTGDAHARQGDGEVCLTAIETAMDEAVVRLSVEPGEGITQPRAETPTHWITLGFAPELWDAAQSAVRDMIELLVVRYELSRADAYTLCSVGVDLAVTQVVNGVKGVHAKLPKEFVEGRCDG